MAQLTLHQAFDLARDHQQAGRTREAEILARQILVQQPAHCGAIHLLGIIALQAGRDDLALDFFRRAIALDPAVPETHFYLGNVLRNSGQPDAAISAFRQAIALRPDYAEACNNLGNVLKTKGLLNEAVAAFRHAVALNPSLSITHNNLGNALRDAGRLDEAIAAFRLAIALDPGFPQAHYNLGNTLRESGQLNDAIAAFQKAISLNPDFPQAHSNLLFALHYHPAYDARAIAEELLRWNRQFADPLRASIQPHSNDRQPNRRLRIGYVSPDFRNHVVGRNLLPLFRRHDRRQFEITCYSQTASPDAITAQFREHADAWHNIVDASDEQVAGQIRHDRIDILVDLALHTAHSRLLIFARKPAPVQATFAGYPGSTGLSAIDYRLSDPYLDPPGIDESLYSERTIRLPDTFWCYDPLDGRDVPVNPLPALTSAAFAFGCLNNFCKVNDDVLALWARVLRLVENSRLLLLAPAACRQSRVLELLQREGIEPRRVEFVAECPRQKYLQTYHRIDLGLDAFPYNGHTTSLDSFWMGVPVVTLVGNRAVARAGWSQLSNLGLTELAAQTPDQFVSLAVDLARDLTRLSQLRSTLRPRMEHSPLMDAPKFARDIEAAYRQMWHTWCQSPSPGN